MVARSFGDAEVRVLAVVVTYNPDDALECHLRALRKQCAEVLVVDNASSSQEQVAETARRTGCRFVSKPRNVGIAAALNEGVRLSVSGGFSWLATFDQDSLCPDGAIEGLLDTWRAHPQRPAIGLIAVSHSDRVLLRDYHHSLDILCETPNWRLLRSTITSGSMISVKVLGELGGFEDRLFIDSVDHELCLRLRRHGWLILESRRHVMPHSIGAATVHSLFGHTVVCTNHTAARRYYRVRNQLEVSVRNLLFDPTWAIKGILQLISGAIAVTLFEHGRMAKLGAMARGVIDFARRRFGSIA